MIEVSEKFKSYSANPKRKVEYKCLVDGVEYTDSDIIDVDIEDAIISSSDFELGAVISSKLVLSLRTSGEIANNAEIKPSIRFVVDGDPTEWIQQGVMYIDSRFKITTVYKFSCYDKLITATKDYFTDLEFPNTMYQILVELAYNLGIEIDESTLEMINVAYTVSTKPEDGTYSFRDIIKFIAISHGCSARMNSIGKLDFVPFIDRTSIKTISTSESWSVRELNPFKEVKKLVFNYDTNLEPIIIGEGDESVTLYVNNPWITEEIANEVFTDIYDLSYNPVSFNWRCEPWIQPGDFITVQTRSESFNTLILRMRKKYKGGLNANVEAPSSTGTQSEFGFKGTMGTQIADVGRRIGLFSQKFNTSTKKIKQSANQIMNPLAVTTSSETDIMMYVTINFTASVASIVRFTFRIAGSDIGREIRVPCVEGDNFASFQTLIKKFPLISDWLYLRAKIDSGLMTIQSTDAEFVIYGGNLISGEVKPILEFEDAVEMVTMISDNAYVTMPTNIVINLEDTVEVSGISDALGGVDIE